MVNTLSLAAILLAVILWSISSNVVYDLFTTGVKPLTLLTPENLLKVVYVGIAGNMVPQLLFLWSIQRVQGEQAAIVATLEPFVTAIIALIWFGQTLSGLQIIGGILIIVAVTALQIKAP